MVDIPGNITSTATFEGDPNFMATFSGQLETPGDTDWIRVTLRAGRTYEFYGSVQGAGGTPGDAFMFLHDAGGGVVALNDDDVTGLFFSSNSYISYTAPADGTYYVEIRDDFAQPGDYGLAVTYFNPPRTRLSRDDDHSTVDGGMLVIGDAGNDNIIADVERAGRAGRRHDQGELP